MSKGFFILLFFAFFECLSQEKNATYHYSLADSLFDARMFDSSYYHFDMASTLYKEENLLKDYYSSRSRMQQIIERKGEYSASITFGKQLLDSALQSLDSSDLVIGDIYLRIGVPFDLSNEFDSALFYHYKALRIWNLNPEVKIERLLLSYRNIAGLYSLIHNLDSTVKYSNKAFALIESSDKNFEEHYGAVQNNLAGIFADFGMKEAALKSYESALEIFEKIYGTKHINSTITYLNLGFLYKDTWDLYKSKFYFDRAYKNVKDDPSNAYMKNLALGGFAEIYRIQGAYEEAISYLNQGINNLIAEEGEDYFQLPSLYNNLGLCYLRIGDFDQARFFLKKAFDKNKSGVYNPATAFGSISNLANVLYEEKDYVPAQEYYNKAIQICKTEHNSTDDLSLALSNKAQVLLRLNKLDEAYEISQQVLSQKINSRINYHPELPRFYSIHAEILYNLKMYDSAIFYFDKSLNANVISDITNLDNFEVFDQDIFFSAMRIEALVYLDLYELENKLEHLKSAITTYKKLGNTAFKYSIDFNNEKDRFAFTNNLTEVHFEAIRLAKDLLMQTGDSSYLDDVFNLFQNSRSISLKHRISSRSIKQSCGIPDSLLLKEAGMRSERKYLRSELLKENQGDTSQNFNDLKNRLLELNKEISELKEQFKNYCDGYNDVPQYTKDEIASQLKKNHALIQYLTNQDSIYALMIYNGDISFKRLNDLTYLEKPSSYSPEYYHGLYKELIASIAPADTIESLTIIPDGKIWGLNFDLFLTELPTTEDYKKMPYLLKKYPINYAYSFNSLFDNESERNSSAKQILAFSFANENSSHGNQISLRTMRSEIDELPGSLNEVRNISKLYEGEYVYGNYASEKLFKEIANDYSLLHLAIHGDIDDAKPENSKLYFYAQGDSIEDGKLHAFELYDMELSADLAVLSACNTGSGKIVNGEGVMSLGRAFTYAGVESLLLTRNEVADAFTPKLMQLFYEELKKGKRKSEALRDAKITFLMEADEISVDPFYWSSFYILGNDSPIDSGNNKLNKFWIYAIAILAIVAVRFRRKTS